MKYIMLWCVLWTVQEHTVYITNLDTCSMTSYTFTYVWGQATCQAFNEQTVTMQKSKQTSLGVTEGEAASKRLSANITEGEA